MLIDLIDDWQEQETPLYYGTKGGSRDRGLRADVGTKVGEKVAQNLINDSGALPNNRLNYRSNEAIKIRRH